MSESTSDFARKNWLCTGCRSPRPKMTTIDVHLQDIEPTGDINVVFGFGIPLIRKEIIMEFDQKFIKRDLYIGRVFNRDDKELTDWVTFRARQRLIIRGSKHAGTRKCEQCGRILYFAMGSRYLCPSPENVEVLSESDLCGLIIPEQIYNNTLKNFRKLKKVQCDRLPVLVKPKDGLPINLDGK